MSGIYDKDRADECNEIPARGDQYNASWIHGCEDHFAEVECAYIINHPTGCEINGADKSICEAYINTFYLVR